MKREDGRTRYTKMMIKKSFISLMEEKPAAKITVTEICERAEINRATFYTHYKDTEDLYDFIKTELQERVKEDLVPVAHDECPDIGKNLERLFCFFKENSEVCRVLLMDTGDTGLLSSVVSMLQTELACGWADKRSIPMNYAELLFAFAAIGGAGLLKKWLLNGTPQSPQELAEIIVKINDGIFAAFSTNNQGK